MGSDVQVIKGQIARAIREARNSRGMTKADLAKAVGVNVSTVTRWEDDADPDPPGFDKAVQLARVLEVSLDQLAFGQQPFFERVVLEVIRQMDGRYVRITQPGSV